MSSIGKPWVSMGAGPVKCPSKGDLVERSLEVFHLPILLLGQELSNLSRKQHR